MIWKFITFLVSGFCGSRALYRRTHGVDALFPETVGLVSGGLLVLCAYCALRPGDEDGQRALVVSFASVGIGVGFNRVLTALES